ncbi:ABC transporter ATP-binding protein [Cellulomonas sp. URHB0016]
MIVLDDVTVRYGTSTPLDGVTIAIGSGTTAVMGPSGSGKSTLLRVIGGLQRPDSGTVTINDSPVVTATWRTASDPRVALIHQDYRLVPFLTVEQNLLLASEIRGVSRSAADVVAVLARVNLGSEMGDRYPASMSGGEQQRVAIGRALIVGAPVIVADEPTGALDVENTERVTEILVHLGSSDGLTVVVATHDPTVAARLDARLALASGILTQAVAA